MIGNILGAIPAVAGLLGGGGQQAGPQMTREQRRAQKAQLDALMRMMNLAKGYDPQKENQEAIDFAGKQAQSSVQNALSNLYQGWGGGQGGDSEFAVRAQGVTNRATDPLRAFAAEKASNLTADRMRMYQAVTGQSLGSLGTGYFQQPQQSMLPSAMLLSQAIRGMMPTKARGATGPSVDAGIDAIMGGVSGVRF